MLQLKPESILGAAARGCAAAEGVFKPTRLSIPRAIGPRAVLPRGRDRRGVRLTAHTYPWSGAYGSALGNRLLSRLRQGALIW